MRIPLLLISCLSLFSVRAQTSRSAFSQYAGKYENSGMVVQISQNNGLLVLVVPGAPLQELSQVEKHMFRSNAFSDATFRFVEKNGKIIEMISEGPGESVKLTKFSDTPDDFNGADALLVLKKSTAHFTFLYSSIDSTSVSHIANKLEGNYQKILTDFKMQSIPVTTVRIYPDLKSFQQGINFPGAPSSVLATAFGKSDFRMVSPNVPGLDSLMLMNGVTHEFTHCVHLNIDYSPNNPRWLWEGVAMYEADWFFDPKEIEEVKNKQYPKLATLNNGMEYMLGYVIIEAIRDIWGFDAVINLIKHRGDAQTVLKINEAQFEKEIFDHIYKKYIQK